MLYLRETSFHVEIARISISNGLGMAIKQKREWFLHIDGENQGPFTLMEVRNHFQDKKIKENTLIWQKGMKDWEYVKKISAVTQKEFPSQFAAIEGIGAKSDPLLMEAGYESHKTQTDLTIEEKKAAKEKPKAEPQEKIAPEVKRRRGPSGTLNTDSFLRKVGERTITDQLARNFPLEGPEKASSKTESKVKKKKVPRKEPEETPELRTGKSSFLDDKDELTLAEKVSIMTSLQEERDTEASQGGAALDKIDSETQPSIFLLDEKEGTLKEMEEAIEAKDNLDITSHPEVGAGTRGSILTEIIKQKEQLEENSSSMESPLGEEEIKEVEERTTDIEVGDSKDFKEEDKIWTLKTEKGVNPATLSYQEILDMGVAGNLPSKFFLKKSGSKDFLPETNFPDLVEARKSGKKSIASLLSFSKKDVASVKEKLPPHPPSKGEEKNIGSVRSEDKDFSMDIELPSVSLEEDDWKEEAVKGPVKKPTIAGKEVRTAKITKKEKKDITSEENELTGASVFETLRSSSFVRLKKGKMGDIHRVDTLKIKKGEEIVEEAKEEEKKLSLKEILQKKEKKEIEVTYIEKPKRSKMASIFHFFKMVFYLAIFAGLAYLGFTVYKSISITHYFKNFPDIAGISLVDYEKIKKLISQERIGDRSSFTHVLSKDGLNSHSIHVATNAEAGKVMKMHLYGEAGELVNRISFFLKREEKVPSSGIVSFSPLRDDNGNPLPMGKYRARMQIEGERGTYSSHFLLGGTSQEDYERRMKLYKEKLQDRYDKEYTELRQLIQTTLSVYSKLHIALKNMKSKKKESFSSYAAWKKFLMNTGILMEDMERIIAKSLAEDQVPVFYPIYYEELGKLSQGIKMLLSKEKEIWEASQPLLTSGIQKISASKNHLASFLSFTEPDEPAKVLVRNYGGDNYHRVEEFFSDREI